MNINNPTGIDREAYERDLAEKRKEHFADINKNKSRVWRPCLHDSCPNCLGTGTKKDGTSCIHMISCNCSKCKPYNL